MTKAEMRRMMRTKLDALDPEERRVKSQAIAVAVLRDPALDGPRTLALFDAMANEPDLAFLWSWGKQCRLVFPRVMGAELTMLHTPDVSYLERSGPLQLFREPRFDEKLVVPAEELEVVLIPGLAFTRDGRRLGRGGGYYDRLLARLPRKAVRLGICFELQIADSVPSELHDLCVDRVITESGVY